QKAHVPDDVKFQTKPEIALDQIRAALAAGVAPGVLLADAGYGVDGVFRSGVTALGLTYAVGVQSTLSTRRFAPKSWRQSWPARLGGRCLGARAPTKPCPLASPPCGSGQPRATG